MGDLGRGARGETAEGLVSDGGEAVAGWVKGGWES